MKIPNTEWICPFKIVYDTAEQLPYTFRGLISDVKEGELPIVVATERRKLATADYTIHGWESVVCVERKSGQDLLGTLLNGKTAEDRHRRDNFFKELDRMQSYDHSLIVVEASLVPWLRSIPNTSRANQRAMLRTILSIQQDYRMIQWGFLDDRQCAEKFVFDYLKRFWKNRKKVRPHETLP